MSTITPPPPQDSFTHVYNNHLIMNNFHDHSSGLDMMMKQHINVKTAGNCCYNQQEQDQMMIKRRLTNEQLQSLENSFQEATKLEPDRKMRLSKELGLHPRQVAVWFQNRRARWKTKQVEIMYNSLKQQFDLVSKQKQQLQQEVLALKAILEEQTKNNQVSTHVDTKSMITDHGNFHLENQVNHNLMPPSSSTFW